MSLDDFPSEAELEAGVARAPESEDLFDFPRIVAFDEGARPEASRAEPASLIAGADLGSDFADENDLLEVGEHAAPSITRLMTEPAAEMGAARAVHTPARSQEPHYAQPSNIPAASAAPVVIAAPASSRALWVIAAAALLLNVGLFAFIWQNSRAVEATLLEVRAERTRPITISQSSVPSPVAALPLTDAPIADSTTPRRQQAAPFEPTEEVALRLAREELAAGKPADARRRLFGVLATIDGLEPARREPIEAAASFLVAETFRDQAANHAEDRP